jgi:hypothetical protein
MPTVAMYVSGHGFGHAVRSAEVVAALLKLETKVVIRTDAPDWLFPAQATYVKAQRPMDIGVAQHDGLELDIDQTRRRWRTFADDFELAAQCDAEQLRQHEVDFVVGDIPPLAFAAAARAGIRSAAMGNFGWDWIYGAWPDFQAAIQNVQRGYAEADLLYRLPFHSTDPDAFPGFKRVEDVPLIARRASQPRHQVRAALGLAEQQTVVLLSFGAFGLDGLALPKIDGAMFVVSPPLGEKVAPGPNVLHLNKPPTDYVSLLAAADVVVTKPGYGIVADSLANRVAMLYTNRGPFREYDVLVAALHSHGRAHFIPREDLLVGNIAPYLEALAANTTPWTDQPMNGATVVANRVMQQITVRGKAVT